MEYKVLRDTASEKLEAANARKAILEQSIIGKRRTLDSLLKAQQRNPDAFRGQVGERIARKTEEITSSEEAIVSLSSAIESQRGLINAISQFNPCRQQADRQVVQEQFIFAKGSKWLEWNASKRHEAGKGASSRFKTFQDIFTPPQYRILPKREGAYGNTDFDELSLDPVIVDPARISDTFLQEFESAEHGIVPVPEESHDLDRLRAKRDMIPPVKSFFQKNVKPVSKGSFEGGRLNYRVLVVEGYDPKHDGKLIIPHYDTSEKPEERSKVMAIYSNAYSAKRRTMKLYPGYETESRQLHQVRIMTDDILHSLLDVRTKDPDYDKVLDAARSGLRKTLDVLGGFEGDSRNPRTHHKKSAHRKLLTTTELTDTLGRLNKGASLAKLVSVCRDILARIEEVDHTSIAGPVDQNTISAIINQSEMTLSQYGQALQDGADKQRFERMKGTLQKLKVRPFNLYAGKLMASFDVINRSRKSDVRSAELKKALAVTRLFAAHKLVEDLITAWDANPAVAAKRFTSVLIDELSVPGFEIPFVKVKEAVSEAYALTENGIPENPEDVREILKGIDFEELLSQIQ